MINKKPTTYNEIVRLKKCYTLTTYFTNITENMFNEIYDFLGQSETNSIVANQDVLALVDPNGKIVKTYTLIPKYNNFDSIEINDGGIVIVPHYDPSSSGSDSSSSSNNNNNNNNNNNS